MTEIDNIKAALEDMRHKLDQARQRQDALRIALELIALGEAHDAAASAVDALVLAGIWNPDEAQDVRATMAAQHLERAQARAHGELWGMIERYAAARVDRAMNPTHVSAKSYEEIAESNLRAFLATREAAPKANKQALPEGYKMVLVPEVLHGGEPDWEEIRRQAEVATGLNAGPAFDILVREVRRWLCHKAAEPPAGVISGQVAWDGDGGNPGIKATQQVVRAAVDN